MSPKEYGYPRGHQPAGKPSWIGQKYIELCARLKAANGERLSIDEVDFAWAAAHDKFDPYIKTEPAEAEVKTRFL